MISLSELTIDELAEYALLTNDNDRDPYGLDALTGDDLSAMTEDNAREKEP
jgi:hypothetical protein